MEFLTTLNEGQDYTFTLNTPIDTTGDILSVVFREYSASGTGTILSTANGSTAKTNILINLSTGVYDNGDYLLELWQNLGDSDQALIFPTEGNTYKITIQDRMRG